LELAILDRESVPAMPAFDWLSDPDVPDMELVVMPFRAAPPPPLWFTFELFIPDPLCMPAEDAPPPAAEPVPCAMTGAASSPNAHTDASSPAFNID
jgi:hypothetical protein